MKPLTLIRSPRPLGLLLALLLAALAAGCASGVRDGEPDAQPPPPAPPVETGPSYPGGPLDVVVDVSRGGGFVPVEVALDDRPDFRLYGDGTVLVRPTETVWVALPTLLTYRLTPEGAAAVLEAAGAAGILDGPVEYGSPPVTDLPTTTVTVTTDAGTATQAAYALDFSDADDTLPASEREAREALRDFVELLVALPDERPELLDARPAAYAPEAMDVYAWQFEGEAPDAVRDWPLSTPLGDLPTGGAAGSRCVTVSGDDLAALLGALEGVEGGAVWRSGPAPGLWSVAFRLVLPGGEGCPAAG